MLMTLSRNGTLFFMSPPSRLQSTSRRRLIRAPAIPTRAGLHSGQGHAFARRHIGYFARELPRRVQISASFGKSAHRIRCENGRLIFATRKYSPLGEGVTLSKIAGRPTVFCVPSRHLSAPADS